MQKCNFVYIIILLLLFLMGCQNTTDPNIQEETKHVSISNSEVFNYQTGISGDEESVIIVEQPNNYSVSTVVRDSTTNWEAVYRYRPEGTFQGTEHVELKIGSGSDGQSVPKNIKLIKLNITVN